MFQNNLSTNNELETTIRTAVPTRGTSKRIVVNGACYRSPQGSMTIRPDEKVMVKVSPRGGSILVVAPHRVEVWRRITLREENGKVIARDRDGQLVAA